MLPALERRNTLDLVRTETGGGSSSRYKISEVAGGATAELTAICCCLPCTVMGLLYLTLYKAPAGLCKKVWHKERRRRIANKKHALLRETPDSSISGARTNSFGVDPFLASFNTTEKLDDDDGKEPAKEEAFQLEKEILEEFSQTGFWRSPSHKEKN